MECGIRKHLYELIVIVPSDAGCWPALGNTHMKLFWRRQESSDCLDLEFWRLFSVKGIQVKLIFHWKIIHLFSHNHAPLHLFLLLLLLRFLAKLCNMCGLTGDGTVIRLLEVWSHWTIRKVPACIFSSSPFISTPLKSAVAPKDLSFLGPAFCPNNHSSRLGTVFWYPLFHQYEGQISRSTLYKVLLFTHELSFCLIPFLQKLNLVSLPQTCCKFLGENLHSLTFYLCWTWHILKIYELYRATLKTDGFPVPSPHPSPCICALVKSKGSRHKQLRGDSVSPTIAWKMLVRVNLLQGVISWSWVYLNPWWSMNPCLMGCLYQGSWDGVTTQPQARGKGQHPLGWAALSTSCPLAASDDRLSLSRISKNGVGKEGIHCGLFNNLE